MTESKNCARCGRVMEYRKKWAANWAEVKYCSDRCRKSRRPLEPDEDSILALLRSRAATASICPSEILPATEKQNKARMEEVREAARRLAHRGEIVITQKNKVVEPSDFRGPIRLKLLPAKGR